MTKSNQAPEQTGSRREFVQEDASGAQLMVLLGLVAVLFFFGNVILGRWEILTDVDFKPYFIPLLFVALLPLGRAGKIPWAIGLGAAVGEAIGDLLEGYEVDDPFGFFGYLFAFAVAGYIIANRPFSWTRLIVGSMAAAVINAALEAFAFYLFGVVGVGGGAGEETIAAVLTSFVGNTITHGIIMGAVPLIALVYLVHGRIERSLGFAPLPRN